MDKCVYIHKRPDTKEVFYVGEGGYTRPFSKSSRSDDWNFIVDTYGIEIIVLYTRLSKDEALNRDHALKDLYGFENLVNKLPGRESEPWNLGLRGGKASDGAKKAWETRRENGTDTTWNKGKKGVQKAWNKGIKTPGVGGRKKGSIPWNKGMKNGRFVSED